MEHDTVLVGEHVTLRPLTVADAPVLVEAADEESWRWMTVSRPGDLATAEAFIADLLGKDDNVPFAVTVDGAARGITTFHDHQPAQLGTFIGWTLYARELRGDGRTNPESKLLLMSHAFDGLGFERVGLRADGRNAHSRAAIAKLGAVEEGTLRSHLFRPDGTRRDTVLFSVLRAEWPSVKAGLEGRLGR